VIDDLVKNHLHGQLKSTRQALVRVIMVHVLQESGGARAVNVPLLVRDRL
jgi:hypothetical protein